MINHKAGFYLGVFIFVIPFLGFPTMWKMGLVIFGGLSLILMSIRIPVPRRMTKNKTKKENFVSEIEKFEREEPAEQPEKKEEVVAVPEVSPLKIEVIEPRQKTSVPIRKTRKVSAKVDSITKLGKQ
jgi:hypothetical protein